jgi:hypothetical protein
MSAFARSVVIAFGVLLAALGGAWLAYYIVDVMLRLDLWRNGLIMASFGLIPLVVAFCWCHGFEKSTA